jgi:hypothetical protein
MADFTTRRVRNRFAAEFGLRVVEVANGKFEVYRDNVRLSGEEILYHCALARGLSEDEAQAFAAQEYP